MIYTIENNLVYRKRYLPSGAEVKTCEGNKRKTKIYLDDLNNATIKWQKFNIELGKYVDDEENSEKFIVEISGQMIELEVGELLELEIEEPGTHTLRTMNDNATNDSLEVVVDG